jgi:hypothetical protein
LPGWPLAPDAAPPTVSPTKSTLAISAALPRKCVSQKKATRLGRCGNSGRSAGGNDVTADRVNTLARSTQSAPQAIPLRAALSGKHCVAEGIYARGSAPILALCRALIAAGHDPDRALHVYRGSTPAVVVGAIGKAAKLTVEDDSRGRPRFRRWRDRTGGTAPHVRQNAQPTPDLHIKSKTFQAGPATISGGRSNTVESGEGEHHESVGTSTGES